MKQVWKYEIPMEDKFQLDIPFGSQFLSVAMQGEECCLWVLVNPKLHKVSYEFRLAGTGHPIEEISVCANRHIGTVLMRNDALVFHLFLLRIVEETSK